MSNEQTCRVLAQNENGEDSASILVTVTAPPSPPGQPVVIDITGTTCVLRYLRSVAEEKPINLYTDGNRFRMTEAPM